LVGLAAGGGVTAAGAAGFDTFGAAKRAGSSVSISSFRPPNHLANHIFTLPKKQTNQRDPYFSDSEDYTSLRGHRSRLALIVKQITLP
jgi:hypothetical protein